MRLKVPSSAVENCTIWGNHSSTQYPDVSNSVVATAQGKQKVGDVIQNPGYLHGEFIKVVQQRGAAIINARKLSSAMSAAKAISDHMHDWVVGSNGKTVSMAVPSDGSYGIEKGLIYSFPVVCSAGKYTIVQNLKVDQFSRKMMDETMNELKQERDTALAFLNKDADTIARSKL